MKKTLEQKVFEAVGCGGLSRDEGLKIIKNASIRKQYIDGLSITKKNMLDLPMPIDFTDGNKPNQETPIPPIPPIPPKPPGARVLNNGTSSIEDGFNHFCCGVVSGFVIGVFTAMVILNLVNGG